VCSSDLGRAVAKSYDGSPLLYGLIGLAAGTALAMFLPPTRPEDRLMGPRRDQLVSAAEARWRAMRGQAEDVTIQGLQSATDTLRSASDSVVEQIKRAEASTRSSIADGAAVVEDLVAQKLDALREQQPV
jgi:flagellar hook-basal body complex protein FliE